MWFQIYCNFCLGFFETNGAGKIWLRCKKILDSAGVPLLLNRTRLNFLKEGLMKSFILYPSAHGARAGV